VEVRQATPLPLPFLTLVACSLLCNCAKQWQVCWQGESVLAPHSGWHRTNMR
jgi:hypothetical protein